MIVDFIFAIIRWLFILAWRFFSGAHMNGRTYNDATWWQDASVKYKKMRSKYTWWRRKSRVKRAAWRHGVFWPALILSVGFAVDWVGMLFVIGMLSPGLFLVVRNRVRLALFFPVVAHESDGSVHQTWTLKPKVRRRWNAVFHPKGERRRPGLALASELKPAPRIEEIPGEYANAVRGEVLSELDGQPPIELKLLLDPEVDFE